MFKTSLGNILAKTPPQEMFFLPNSGKKKAKQKFAKASFPLLQMLHFLGGLNANANSQRLRTNIGRKFTNIGRKQHDVSKLDTAHVLEKAHSLSLQPTETKT